MNDLKARVMTGGCQCGALRYALHAEPIKADICHCRMCQKAVGGPFAALTSLRREDFSWTRGKPGLFMSSPAAERGFCPDCGTPLTFRYVDTDRISVTLGSLDDPGRVAPQRQYGAESRLPWFKTLHKLPATTNEQDLPGELLNRISSGNRQHPDHDTEDWAASAG